MISETGATFADAKRGLLHGVRVLDAASGIAASYCTKLLSDADADVTKLEPAAGDPLRRFSASHTVPDAAPDGALFRYLNTSKRSVMGKLGDPAVEALLAGADLLVEGGLTDDATLADLRVRFPSLNILSITAFGRSGPWSKRPASDLTLQAACGSVASRGDDDREPVKAGGQVGQWVAGAFASVAAMAAIIGGSQGKSRHLDFSIFECMAIAMQGYASLKASLGGTGWPIGKRQIELPSVEPSADGWVCLTTNSRQQFDDFLVMIERSDLLDDQGLKTKNLRNLRRAEFESLVAEWTTKRSTAEILELAAAFRVPAAEVARPSQVMGTPHLVARNVYVPNPDGTFLQPRPAIRAQGIGDRVEHAAPQLGEHTGKVRWNPRNRRADARSPAALPMAGYRIVELTNWWAGPSVGQVLAALGADVIKVESGSHPDGQRLSSTAKFPPEDNWWETSYIFQSVNVNKLDITLDLRYDQGRRILLDLISVSDAVVENFSPRVLEEFGISWDIVHERNPKTIMVRMPAFGLDGPWRDRPGFAQTMEALSGMAWMTGYKDRRPILPLGPCDPMAGMHAAFALAAALFSRQDSGEGIFIEAPMIESALCGAAEATIEWSAYGAELTRDGNRGPDGSPQGIYPCRGEDEWVAISVCTNAQWRALCEAIGNRDLADDHELCDVAARRSAENEIDATLSEWTKTREANSVAEYLTARGVPAARVTAPVDVVRNPQLKSRGFIETIEHPVLGTHEVLSMPFQFASPVSGWIRRPAPMLGQHTEEILREVLHLDEREIGKLREAGVTNRRLS
jgi:crotonobetainyl-CoA:carnitine CoA-transferase CaiB-like acyl-CoA transferase